MKGVGQFNRNIEIGGKRMINNVERAAYGEAQVEVTEIKRRTPVDITEDAPHPGQLRNSIHAEEPVREGKKIIITIATGQEAPYGIYVHENPDAFHPVGQWKFIESVLNESRPYMAQRIASRAEKI